MSVVAVTPHTTKCVRCFKPAKLWGGHVLRGREKILAGWCSQACAKVSGFTGQHTSKMGLSREG